MYVRITYRGMDAVKFKLSTGKNKISQAVERCMWTMTNKAKIKIYYTCTFECAVCRLHKGRGKKANDKRRKKKTDHRHKINAGC